jgi:electron transfer flavoprotein beta subunit
VWCPSDASNAQVGPTIAEFLDLPQITCAINIMVDEVKKEVTVTRLVDRGDQLVVNCSLPCVVSVEENMQSMLYPTVPMRLMAKEAFVRKYDPHSLGLSNLDIGVQGSLTLREKLFSPRPKTKGAIVPDNSLSVKERINLLLSIKTGPKKDVDLLAGDPAVVANKVTDFLVQKGLLNGLE